MIDALLYFLTSLLLVGVYRGLALRYRWLDHPNQRSSHQIVTPRGAGVVFAALIVAACGWLLDAASSLPFVLGGALVALTGWYDDLRSSSARLRFALYTAGAAGAVAAVMAQHASAFGADLGTAAVFATGLAATLALVWLINLYNFMDGINGIAAGEALFALVAAGIFARQSPYADAFGAVHVFSAAAIGGFLLWNFPAGKVFMGDAGSAFLGFLLGLLALCSALLQGPSITVWLILLGVFVVDASYTLAVRMATGQAWHSAHRLHAYQRLTDRLGNHSRAVAAVMAVNIGWLLPIAWLAHRQHINELAALALAYAPLLGACCGLGAGIPGRGRV